MYEKFYETLASTPFSTHLDQVQTKVEDAFASKRHGDLPKWLDLLEKLPQIKPSEIKLNISSIQIGKEADADLAARTNLETLLREFHPWRKGPFTLLGIHIETEWRSDMKWDRLKNCIEPLKDRNVLDVGCGSGYHLWRMRGEGAKLALGVDPTMLYVMQFQALQKYIEDESVQVLPIGTDDLPAQLNLFDTVFSMGLLYHRRDPLEHLRQMQSFLREGGELVMETLVIEGGKEEILVPKERYAQMRNVWHIPSTLACEAWLKQVGFKDVRLIDVTKTTSEEQRVTNWMGFQSLSDFLDPQDSSKTVEGYPAPTRAIFLAKK